MSALAAEVAAAVDAVSEDRIDRYLAALSQQAPFCYQPDPYPLPSRDDARVVLAVLAVKRAHGWGAV